jgi:hypothetical protein
MQNHRISRKGESPRLRRLKVFHRGREVIEGEEGAEDGGPVGTRQRRKDGSEEGTHPGPDAAGLAASPPCTSSLGWGGRRACGRAAPDGHLVPYVARTGARARARVYRSPGSPSPAHHFW